MIGGVVVPPPPLQNPSILSPATSTGVGVRPPHSAACEVLAAARAIPPSRFPDFQFSENRFQRRKSDFDRRG